MYHDVSQPVAAPAAACATQPPLIEETTQTRSKLTRRQTAPATPSTTFDSYMNKLGTYLLIRCCYIHLTIYLKLFMLNAPELVLCVGHVLLVYIELFYFLCGKWKKACLSHENRSTFRFPTF